MPKDMLPRRASVVGVRRHVNSQGETDSNSNSPSMASPAPSSGRRRSSLTLDASAMRSLLTLPHDLPGDSTPVSAPAPFDTFAHAHPSSPTHEPRNPMTYASLPPSPILPSPPSSPPLRPVPLPEPEEFQRHIHEPPFSLWDYLREELLATDFDSHQELKWERVSNFLNIPLAMEKVNLDHYPAIDSTLMTSDNRLWLHRLLGFFSLHIHNLTHPLCAGYASPLYQPLYNVQKISSSIPESGHSQDIVISRCD